MDPDRDEVQAQIESRLREALSRFGVAGEVSVQSDRAVLSLGASTVSTALGKLVEQWDQLSHEARGRACAEVAGRLAAERRRQLPVAATRPRRSWAPWLLIALAAAACCSLWWLAPLLNQDFAARQPVARRAGPAPSRDLDAYERQRQQRARRACQASSARVARGGTLSSIDTEGWVVEATLLRQGGRTKLTGHPGLGQFLAAAKPVGTRRLIWSQAPELVAIRGPGTQVNVADVLLQQPPEPDWRGLRLSFTGRYVAPYFDAKRRLDYSRLAHALTSQLGATHAALYARCAGGRVHQLGSWFLGPTPADAAAVLVYAMGVFAATPHVAAASVSGDGGQTARAAAGWRAILKATGTLDRRRIAAMVGAQDGLITGPKQGPVTIAFPFRDGSRATRTSHRIASFLGLSSAN